METAALDTLSTPLRVAEDRFTIDIPDGWQQGRGAFGGLVIANLARAIEMTVPLWPIRSISAALPAPVLPGAAEIVVESLRSGSGTSVVAARLLQSGMTCAHAVATLGRPRAAEIDVPAALVVPPAWQSVPIVSIGPPIGPPFSRYFEIRPTGSTPFAGAAEARTTGWVRPRVPGAYRGAGYLSALADVYWPAALVHLSVPRLAATVAFNLQIVGTFDGLDPDAPLYHEGSAPAQHDGYLVDLRSLRGSDGRLLALNQQTFAVIR